MKHLAPLFLLVAASGCNPSATDVEKPIGSAPNPVEKPVKEPPSKEIVGLTLGQEANFPECQKDRSPGYIVYSISQSVRPCWKEPILLGKQLKMGQKPMTQNGEVRVAFDSTNAPRWIYDEADVTIIDGKIEKVVLDTINPDYQAELLTLLSNKWGTPIESSVDNLQNGFGATFQGVKAHWRFDDFTITFHGRVSSEGGMILMWTNKAREHFSAANESEGSF